MEHARPIAATRPILASSARRSWRVLLGLMTLAVVVQGWLLWQPAVPAPDCVRFVALAQSIQEHGVLETFQKQNEQPLFPMAVWLAHAVLQTILGDAPGLWRLSAQAVASGALVLTVLPVYLLSRRLYGFHAAGIGAALFCTLPHIARLGPQGISDPLHCLFFAWAAWAVVAWLDPLGRGAIAACHEGDSREAAGAASPLWMLFAGLATATAILVRAEAAVLAGAILLSSLLLQAAPRWRQEWRAVFSAWGWYSLGLLAVGLPYLALLHVQGPEAAVRRMLGRPNNAKIEAPPNVRAFQLCMINDRPLSFDIKEAGTSRRPGLISGLRLFAKELPPAFWYWGALAALYGLWATRRLRGRPVDWFVRTFSAVYCLTVLIFATREGYLQARHFAPLVILTIGCAGHGIVVLGHRITAAWRGAVARRLEAGGRLTPAAAIVAAIAIAGCLAYFLKPVGAADGAHRAAGQWLATQPPGIVVDTRGLTGLFSGRPTGLFSDAPVLLFDPSLAYFVVESWEVSADSRRGRTLGMLLGAAGEQIRAFPAPECHSHCRDVEVYRWDPEAFTRFQVRQAEWMARKDGACTNAY